MVLEIYAKGSQTDVRYTVEKWTFHDKYMGEQYVTFDIKSPTIIPWEVGDYCIFRGQTYTLNYIPSCKQTARMYDTGDAFVYEGVKFNPPSDDLTRCIMLDVVPTTGDYDQYKGTNYTGSAVFTLYCGETTWEGHTYAPVHALADRIKANLDRLYPDAGWQIFVNDEACHSDDFTISFNNWTAMQALAEVHNTFKCDYAIIGRSIYIGYSMPELTSRQSSPTAEESPDEAFYFGYGKGYPTADGEDGTALFEIKKVANSNQNIITRLRAYGSTKNLPYRYYMSRYNLPQTMYVHNLQLPDTFVPYSKASDPKGEYQRHKTDGNKERDEIYKINEITHLPNIRHVFGETNDAYIDKGDDAASCEEGIREGVGAWDGSNADLEEIYPTIQEMTYGELRGSSVPDILGVSGRDAYKSRGRANPYYQDAERVDELLGIGEDCNIGDGIVPLGELEKRTMTRNVDRDISGAYTDVTVVSGPSEIQLLFGGTRWDTKYQIIDLDEILIATFEDVLYEGNYTLSPTDKNVVLRGHFSCRARGAMQGVGMLGENVSPSLFYRMRVVQVSSQSGQETEIANCVTHVGNIPFVILPLESGLSNQSLDVPIEAIPDSLWLTKDETPQIDKLHISEASTIKVYLQPIAYINISAMTEGVELERVEFRYEITHTDSAKEANLILSPVAGESIADGNFHIHLKELGFDLSQAQTIDDGAPQITMKTGNCVGRTFDIVSVEPYTDPSTGKRGWDVELSRSSDDVIHVYYPNSQNTLQIGNRFVLTNIELPDAYIKAAEIRLLRAATDYLADNCETKYTHEPQINDIYIQQNFDRCLSEGRKEDSIFWRLYAGLKFPFRGIPESEDERDPLPILNITISQVEIKIGEKDTPQVTLQLNDDLEQSTIQKLTTAVDRLYNSVGGYAGNSNGGAVSTSAFYQLLRTEGTKIFLSRTSDDTAHGQITFEKKTIHEGGAQFGEDYAVEANGDAALRDIEARDVEAEKTTVAADKSTGRTVATFGQTRDSLLDGTGTLISDDGRMQTTTMEVRGTMKVLDLVASQIHSLNGYYYFSDTMKIARAEERWLIETPVYDGKTGTTTAAYETRRTQPDTLPDGATATLCHLLTFEKEYENDFLKFYDGDILLSAMVDLGTVARRDTDEAGNAVARDVASQSWMRVILTSEDDGWPGGTEDTPETYGQPRALVVLCPSADVPGGVNHAPQGGYYVARRGNADTADPAMAARQRSWCISVEEGRLVYYINQTSAQTADENYGVAVGLLPDIKPVREAGKAGEVGIYAKNLLVENLVTVKWAGEVQYVTIDLGEWTAGDAEAGAYYYSRERTEEKTVITRCQVVHHGSVWQTTAALNSDGRRTITEEPLLASTGWVRISGATRTVVSYTTTQTDTLEEGGVGFEAEDDVEWFTDQRRLLEPTVEGKDNPYLYCALRPYMWRRAVTTTADGADSYESEPPHIIGVYGETGVTYHIRSNYDNIIVGDDEESHRVEEQFTFWTDGGGVRNPFDCKAMVRIRRTDGEYRDPYHRIFAGTSAGPLTLEVTAEDAAIEVCFNSSGKDIPTTYLCKKEIPILRTTKGDPGIQGYAGAIVRVFQNELVRGRHYASATDGPDEQGISYQDFLAIEGDYGTSGYLCFRCRKGYTEATGADMSGSPAADQVRAELPTDNWEEVSINALSAFFVWLIARNANIKMLTGSQFSITDAQGKVLAGMGNRTDAEGHRYYLWSGGAGADDATFKVFADGTLEATAGRFSGFVTRRATILTARNVARYVAEGINPFTGEAEFLLNLDTVGSNVAVFASEGNQLAGRKVEGTDIPLVPTGYGSVCSALEAMRTAPSADSGRLTLLLPFYDGLTPFEANYDVSSVLEKFGQGSVEQGRLNLYRHWLWERRGASVAEAAAVDSVPEGLDDTDWLCHPQRTYSTMYRRAREMTGCKVSLQLLGSTTAIPAVFAYGTGAPPSPWQDDGGSDSTMGRNLLMLECAEDEEGNIAWRKSTGSIAYYDRYTLGLDDAPI